MTRTQIFWIALGVFSILLNSFIAIWLRHEGLERLVALHNCILIACLIYAMAMWVIWFYWEHIEGK